MIVSESIVILEIWVRIWLRTVSDEARTRYSAFKSDSASGLRPRDRGESGATRPSGRGDDGTYMSTAGRRRRSVLMRVPGERGSIAVYSAPVVTRRCDARGLPVASQATRGQGHFSSRPMKCNCEQAKDDLKRIDHNIQRQVHFGCRGWSNVQARSRLECRPRHRRLPCSHAATRARLEAKAL